MYYNYVVCSYFAVSTCTQYVVYLFSLAFQDGDTALIMASWNGDIEVVDRLLNHKPNVDMQKKVNMKNSNKTAMETCRLFEMLT